MQVREDIPVEPVRRPDGGVGGRGSEPVHPAERGAAVRVQLPAQHRRHPGQVVDASADGRPALVLRDWLVPSSSSAVFSAQHEAKKVRTQLDHPCRSTTSYRWPRR
jgi:hypothetical protein